MYGSQLIPVETHNNKESILEVSDSKSHDTFEVHSDFTPQPTPPASTSMMPSKNMMSTTSKKPAMAEKVKVAPVDRA